MKENKPFEHNDFIYTEDGIKYPKTIKFPTLVFKYYAFGKNSVDAFVNSYLYFSHPSQLNDIVDSTDLLLNFKDCSAENYYRLYDFRKEVSTFGEKEIPNYEDAKNDKFIDLRNFIYINSFFNKGILSLTTHPFNKLLMAHYVSEKGFVLEFEPNNLLDSLIKSNECKFINLSPINYSKKIKQINFFKDSEKTIENVVGGKLHILDYRAPFLYLTNVKDKVWEYEKEWRIILEKERMGHIAAPLDFKEVPNGNKIKDGRQIKYNHNCLNRIILAPIFFNNSNFKIERRDINNRMHYSLNMELLQENKELVSMLSFLNKLCSEELKGKVFIQQTSFNPDNLKYVRGFLEIKDLIFQNYIISFNFGTEWFTFKS